MNAGSDITYILYFCKAILKTTDAWYTNSINKKTTRYNFTIFVTLRYIKMFKKKLSAKYLVKKKKKKAFKWKIQGLYHHRTLRFVTYAKSEKNIIFEYFITKKSKNKNPRKMSYYQMKKWCWTSSVNHSVYSVRILYTYTVGKSNTAKSF